jgi:hypothetical protein
MGETDGWSPQSASVLLCKEHMRSMKYSTFVMFNSSFVVCNVEFIEFAPVLTPVIHVRNSLFKNYFAFMLQKKRRMKVKVRGKGRMKKMMHNEERVAET